MPIAPDSRVAARHEIALVIVLAAALFFPGFPMRDLWTPDEPRYMEVAREMVLTGDYLVPRLSGELYPQKPPLFFWLTAGFYRAGFGYNSGRLVAALASIGTVLLVYGLARRLMPRPGPVIASAVTLATLLFVVESKDGVINPLLTLVVVGAMSCGHKALQVGTRARAVWWLGFYLCAALGVLTKGPLGLFIPGVVIGAYMLVNRRRVRSGLLGHVAGAAAMLGVVAAWVVPAVCAGGPEYRDALLGGPLRYVGISLAARPVAPTGGEHPQPAYYYLARFPLDFFPWSLVFPLSFAWLVRKWRREGDESAGFIALWFGVMFVLFTVIPAKRAGYVMPLAPAVGLTIGRYVTGGLRDGPPWPRWQRALLRATFVLCALVAVATGVVLLAAPSAAVRLFPSADGLGEQVSALMTPATLAAGLAAAALMLGLSVAGFRLAGANRAEAVLLLAVAFVLVGSVLDDFVVTPKVNEFKSPRAFAERARPYVAQASKVYLLKNDMSGVYNLYLGVVSTPVLKERSGVREALRTDGKLAFISRGQAREELLGAAAGRYPVPLRMGVSSRVVELIINWDPNTGKVIPPASSEH